MSEDFFTTRELAQRWNLAPATLKNWRYAGKGPLYHKFGGRIDYRIEDVYEFEKDKLRSHTSMPAPSPFHPPKTICPKEIEPPNEVNSKRKKRRVK